MEHVIPRTHDRNAEAILDLFLCGACSSARLRDPAIDVVDPLGTAADGPLARGMQYHKHCRIQLVWQS